VSCHPGSKKVRKRVIFPIALAHSSPDVSPNHPVDQSQDKKYDQARPSQFIDVLQDIHRADLNNEKNKQADPDNESELKNKLSFLHSG